ncbi:hypothetical protein RIF29_26792 [Crotalaria pallida]|uniref:Leucine-rich repeat-containing N-terminal plant-type domain-containing protein n=1 Tax=Crotalaria pallida TaxID=3830 RepID=A0AAN9EQB7_CROPI
MRIPLLPWLSFIFCHFCLILLSVDNITVVSGQCQGEQQSILLQLKNNLKFKSEISTKLESWDESIDCCHWNGVKCDEKGHVTRLDLSGESIYGGFDNSSSLFNLQNLQFLNLATNSFNSIPIEISQLTRLVTLDISSSYYLNNQPLKLLDLGQLVRNLTRIRQLYLDGISITTAHGKEWSKALLQLPSLQELSMSSCNLSGPLYSSLSRLNNLSVIRLDQNNLSSSVPDTFANFRNLTVLSLGSCGLTGIFPKKIFHIPTLTIIDISFNKDRYGSLPDFPFNGRLKTLILSNTLFSGALPVSIGNLSCLSILDLSNCVFNGTLPNSMSKLMELTHLDLSRNNISGPIPPLNLSKNLTYLDLFQNGLTGSITSVHLEGLRKLVHIDLQDNVLNGIIPIELFTLPLIKNIFLSNNNFEGQLDVFSNISSSSLEIMDLSCNKLEGPIPVSIFHLRSLNVLQLSSNKFNGTIHLDMFHSLENLTTLDLSYNNLSIDTNVTEVSYLPNKLSNIKLVSCNLSKFPIFLRNQSILNSLDLSNNHIRGSIPKWIWQWDSLGYLNLSHNLLTKLEEPLQTRALDLPFRTIHFLYVLDLHSNQLQGKLPVFPLQAIYLDYSNNNFSSAIPSDFESCALRTLDLRDNHLRGRIPNSISNCTALEVLDLGKNHIDDVFPCLLEKKLSSLRVMVLRENKFHGPIGCPKINGPWHKLQIVDLAFNNFSGLLPGKFFKTWEAMILDEDPGVTQYDHIQFQLFKYSSQLNYQDSVTLTIKGQQMKFVKILSVFTSIDFSSNNLEGPIPEELMNFTGLYVLNLSGNTFTGQIPSSIGNLKQLESLDLSNNHFSGTILTQLASLNFLSYLNLSFNQLTGKIPTGTQLQSSDASSFEGNVGLYGPPLTQSPNAFVPALSPPGRPHAIEWRILSVELGLVFGLGLLFWKQWRQCIHCCYWNGVNCDEKGHVTRLDLSGESIYGGLDNSKHFPIQLTELTQLDLSANYNSGPIPPLNLPKNLTHLELSHNNLTGTPLQTFDTTYFASNKGLYGPPLPLSCTKESYEINPTEKVHANSGGEFDWTFLTTGAGFGAEAGLVVAPLMFWERGKKWSNNIIDKILLFILPMIGLTYTPLHDDDEEYTKEKDRDVEGLWFNDPRASSSKCEESTLARSTSKVRVCDICGVVGFEDCLTIYNKCNDGAKHIYCMQVKLDKVPVEWTCEECLPRANKLVQHEYEESSKRSKECSKKSTIDAGSISNNSSYEKHGIASKFLPLKKRTFNEYSVEPPKSSELYNDSLHQRAKTRVKTGSINEIIRSSCDSPLRTNTPMSKSLEKPDESNRKSKGENSVHKKEPVDEKPDDSNRNKEENPVHKKDQVELRNEDTVKSLALDVTAHPKDGMEQTSDTTLMVGESSNGNKRVEKAKGVVVYDDINLSQ